MSDDKPEPAWIGNLARTGAAAQAQEQRRQQRLGSSGPANEGRRVALWGCDCGVARVCQRTQARSRRAGLSGMRGDWWPEGKIAEIRDVTHESGPPLPVRGGSASPASVRATAAVPARKHSRRSPLAKSGDVPDLPAESFTNTSIRAP